MKRKISGLLSLAMLCTVFCCSAQILKPVQWSYAAKKTGAGEATVFLKATIDDGWHIYSLHVADGGPVKTSFTFAKSNAYVLTGAATEPKPVSKFEKAFGMNVSYFEHSVIFQQRVKLKQGKAAVTGQLEYMTCNDKQCLPPETVEFTIPVN